MCNNYSKAQRYFKNLLLHWQNKNINKCPYIIIMQIVPPQHSLQILMCIYKLRTLGFVKKSKIKLLY